MKKNISEIVKKVLLEQKIELTTIINPNLKKAAAMGCFDAQKDIYYSKERDAMIKPNATKVPGYPNAVIGKFDETTGYASLEFFDKDFKNKYTAQTMSFACNQLPKISADSIKQEFVNLITGTTANNPTIQIYPYSYSVDGVEPVASGQYDGRCKLKKLSEFLVDREDLRPYLPKTDILIWQCGQTSKASAISADKQALEAAGYKPCTSNDLNYASLGAVCIKDVGGVKMCKAARDTSYTGETTFTNLKKYSESISTSGTSKKDCRNLLTFYEKAAKEKLPISCLILTDIKQNVKACSAVDVSGFLGLDKNKWENLKRELRVINVTNGCGDKIYYSLSQEAPCETKFKTSATQSIAYESVLKKIIKQNLNEISDKKKDNLLKEYKIIKTRFSIITENGKPKTKTQKEKFADELIREIFYLKSQGFDERLINEEFMDIIKSFFGGVPGGIFDTIKEKFVQFILEKLGIGTDGYLANIFIATVGDIPIGDYINGKVFSCQYLSNAISKGVGEGIARKVMNEEGMDGFFYQIIRNSLADMFTDSSFGDKVENAIGQMICPTLPKLKERLNMAGETMKEKALA